MTFSDFRLLKDGFAAVKVKRFPWSKQKEEIVVYTRGGYYFVSTGLPTPEEVDILAQAAEWQKRYTQTVVKVLTNDT